MRDVVALFVEASLAKGEWQAALGALQFSSTTAGVCAAPPYFRLSDALAGRGAWAAALSVLRSAPAPSAGASPSCDGYSAAYLQERVQAYQQVLAAYHTAAQPGLGDDRAPNKLDAREVAQRTWALAKEALAVPGLPVPTTGAPAVSAPPASVATAACRSSVNSLLLWCRTTLLPQQQPTSCRDVDAGSAPLSTAHKTREEGEAEAVAAMQELAALSAAALRGVTEETERVPLPDLAAAPADAPEPSATSTTVTAPASAEAETALASRVKSELRSLFDGDASRAKEAWAAALSLVHELPPAQVSPLLFTALLQHLVQHRRRDEAVALTCECLHLTLHTSTASGEDIGSVTAPREAVVLSQPPPVEVVARLRGDIVVLKTVAEACLRLRCVELATQLLDPAFSNALTPSAAVPLIMTLHGAGRDAAVVEWWRVLQHAHGPQRYPLLKHAKLCSYVAACVLRGGAGRDEVESSRSGQRLAAAPATGTSAAPAAQRQADWARVLAVFSEAEPPAHDPALVLLFQLRLLRQMRQWQAAVQLFSDFRAAHLNGEGRGRAKSPSRSYRPSRSVPPRRYHLAHKDGCPTAMKSVHAVLTEERAEQWIPADALAKLCQQVRGGST